MSLATVPRVGRRLQLLALLLAVLPWAALALAVLDGLRAEIGATDPALAVAARTLALGLPVATLVAMEAMAFLLGSRLLLPAGILMQVARAGAALDFRHAPRPAEADELGRLATAFGRFLRHLTRRRQELDWMAADIASHGLVVGGDARATRLLASLAPRARFAAADPEPAEAWLDAPLHRLLAALAGGVVVLAAAPLGAGWTVAVAATALLAGRLAEPLRRLGTLPLWVLVAAGLALWLLADAGGPAAVARGLEAALAASVAVHFGGGWRGPAGGAADAAWQRAGLAGALAGGGVAVAMLGVLGSGPPIALAVPGLLVGLGLAAAWLSPRPAVATPADWTTLQAGLRLLRQPPVRRRVLGGALPGGVALGTAIGMAAGTPELAVGAALLASLLLTLPGLGVTLLARPWPLPAAGLLAGAAALLLVFGEMPVPALLATAAAMLAWPVAAPDCTGCAAPRQVAILAALLRNLGVVLALAWMALLVPPLLPQPMADPGVTLLPALLPALAAAALLPAGWPDARRAMRAAARLGRRRPAALRPHGLPAPAFPTSAFPASPLPPGRG